MWPALASTSRQVKFENLQNISPNQTFAMDNKRIKFFPSSILEIEQQAIACLVGLKTLQDNHMSIGWDLIIQFMIAFESILYLYLF